MSCRLNITIGRIPAALAFAASLAAGASAQGTAIPPGQQRGMTSAWPMALVISNGGASTGVLIKKPVDLVQPGGTNPYPTPIAALHPGSSFTMALAALDLHVSNANSAPSTTGIVRPIEIDALSTGNAFIPDTTEGAPQLSQAWLALAVSVDEQGGSQPGSHFFNVAQTQQSDPSSDIVGYYYKESQGIGSWLPGKTLVESRRDHLGLQQAQGDNISALDLGMAIQLSQPPASLGRLFGKRGSLFFSVTREWANEFNSLTSVGFGITSTGAMADADPADIYLMRWSGSPGNWTGPHRWATADQLGFEPESNGNVDAMDIQLRGNVVFSAERGGRYVHHSAANGAPDDIRTMNQLMTVKLTVNPLETSVSGQYANARPLRDNISNTSPSELVTYQIGVGKRDIPPLGAPDDDDEVDAVCVWDPESERLDTMVGTPVSHDTRAKTPMGLSMVRVKDPLQTVATHPGRWTAQLTGWGESVRRDSLLVFFHRVGDPNLGAGWSILTMFRRKAHEESVAFNFTIAPLAQSLDEQEHAIMAMQIVPGSFTIGSWASAFVARHD